MIVGGSVVSDRRLKKIYAVWEHSTDEGERTAAKLAALRLGYYIDRAGVMWEKDQVPAWIMKGEPKS